jgi:hypothetical protein
VTRPSECPVPIRPSAFERNNVLQLLAIALGEGRLDIEEFEQRTAAVYAARSDADLGRLLLDLPAPGSPA